METIDIASTKSISQVWADKCRSGPIHFSWLGLVCDQSGMNLLSNSKGPTLSKTYKPYNIFELDLNWLVLSKIDTFTETLCHWQSIDDPDTIFHT